MGPFQIIWKHRTILSSVVYTELRKKYAGSILGLAWLVVYPVLFLAIYSGVYLYIFRIRIPEFSNWQYVLIVFSGLVPYLGFCEALQQGSQSLEHHAHLLKNTVFPIELIPLKTVLCSQFAYAVMLMILFLLILPTASVSGYLWLVPLLLVMQFLFVQGIVWVLSGLVVIVKDVQYLLNLLLLSMLFLSPVAFMPDMVPPALRFLLYLNPLYYFIALYRASFFNGMSFDAKELFVLCFLSVFSFLVGFIFFRKFKEVFVEYV